MSTYTTELRFICETAAGLTQSEGYNSVNSIIEKAAPVIFNFDWPIFNEDYRLVLERKILKHYYTREIAFESVGLFKLKLDDKLNMIMPYYNELYKTLDLITDPFNDVNVERNRTIERKTENDGTQNTDENATQNVNSTTENNTEATVNNNGETTLETNDSTTSSRIEDYRHSDTPQGQLTEVTEGRYLTDFNFNKISQNDGSIQHHTSTSTDSGTSTNKGTTTNTGENITDSNSRTQIQNTEDFLENYLESYKGKQGTQSYSAMLKEYRETILNIDQQVIEELEDLFFQLY